MEQCRSQVNISGLPTDNPSPPPRCMFYDHRRNIVVLFLDVCKWCSIIITSDLEGDLVKEWGFKLHSFIQMNLNQFEII
jgi:hypothetical protein